MSEEEMWKTIEKYPNYMISNLGRIKSLNYKRTGKEQILKQSINGRGYYYVLISINNKYKNILIHKAVAEAFLENNNNYSDVNHIDGNKLNNCITNLEFCTRSENIKHAYKNNLRSKQVGNTYKKRCELAIEYIKIYRSYQKIDNKDYLKGRDEIGCLDICQVDELLEILKEVE